MRFRVGYHFAEPIGKGEEESYDYQKEKWSGRPVLRSGCGAAAESKEENI